MLFACTCNSTTAAVVRARSLEPSKVNAAVLCFLRCEECLFRQTVPKASEQVGRLVDRVILTLGYALEVPAMAQQCDMLNHTGRRPRGSRNIRGVQLEQPKDN